MSDDADGPGAAAWHRWITSRTAAIDSAGRRRRIRDVDGVGPEGWVDGRHVVSFASNDYLGLSAHPAARAAAADAAQRLGTGAGASRLVVGARPIHRELERALADWRGTEAALLFPTGFAANLGVLGVLGDTETVLYSDELNHASIIDGARLARAEVVVYRHRDLDHLGELLATHPPDRRALVVTDTVFSMDGDVVDPGALLNLTRAAGALCVLDEAHAVLGPDVPASALGPDVVRVGTLSKTLGALGGFVAAAEPIIDLLVNLARPFIFTTAPTPPDTAAALAALGVVRGPEGEQRRRQLRRHIDRLLPGHPSPVLPVIVGDERDAVAASDALLARGCLVPAIRPPTVPPGTSRLRIALSAAHTDAHLDLLTATLDELGLEPTAVAP